MPTRIILIRHGQTPFGLKKRYCGLTDIDLNNKGKKQAKKLLPRLHKENIHKVYASDLKRASNFAKLLFKETSIKKSPPLREINFGIFEGMRYEEIMKKYPVLYHRWLNDPLSTVIPKGERFSDFKKRIKRFFKKIVALNKNKTVAVVTHAGPIKIILNDILKSHNLWGIKIDNASVSIIVNNKGKTHIELFNETSYGNG